MVKALLFDVQGTVTDFHSTVCGEAQRISAGRHPDVEWAEVVRTWRKGYSAAVWMPQDRRGGWVSVHSIFRRTLDDVLDEYGVGLSDAERGELTFAWRRLKPWPDAPAGLARLKTTYTLATLSNADVAAVIEISKRAGLPWDAIFAAEMAGVFKPDPGIYQMAATYLGLDPSEIMMVASHKYDIRAARGLGFKTAFVARPQEFGLGGVADVAYSDEFEINASDFVDLAEQLGC